MATSKVNNTGITKINPKLPVKFCIGLLYSHLIKKVWGKIMAKFLVLGTGFVVEPLLEYLQRRQGNQITIAGYLLSDAQKTTDKFNNILPIQLDVTNQEKLMQTIKGYDVVVSLVPASFHPLIAEVCIQHKVHMLTASYQSPQMLALAQKAKDAGIIILNEMGLDPGLDHLSAMQIIDKAHANEDQIESFVSWCGGIPAPDDNDNPLSYKFSWEPRGAIMVLSNDAIYQHNSKVVKVAGENLMQWSQPINIKNLALECYPNRDSASYKEIYGIETVKDILRGTLRYEGFCHIMQAIKTLELMRTTNRKMPKNIKWKEHVLSLNKTDNLDELKNKISTKAFNAINWLGCFSDQPIASNKDNSMDVLCELLLQKLAYKPHEKDMVILQHKFVIKKADGSRQFITSTLKQIGESNGYSGMAKTVGYPAAVASQMIADNKIKAKGLLLPVSKEIYQPILQSLQLEGINFTEVTLSDKQTSTQEFLAELYF